MYSANTAKSRNVRLNGRDGCIRIMHLHISVICAWASEDMGHHLAEMGTLDCR
jgi:hypothetical protein